MWIRFLLISTQNFKLGHEKENDKAWCILEWQCKFKLGHEEENDKA